MKFVAHPKTIGWSRRAEEQLGQALAQLAAKEEELAQEREKRLALEQKDAAGLAEMRVTIKCASRPLSTFSRGLLSYLPAA